MTEKKVLIADDDHELSQSLAIRLRRVGYTVMRSPDASHALIGAMRIKPDLIILDVDMPSGNGLAVCEMLNGDACCHGIPVIIHTGHTDPETVKRCSQLGAVYIHKCPGSPATIAEIAKRFLGIKVEPETPIITKAKKTPATRELSLSYIKSIGSTEDTDLEADETSIPTVSEVLPENELQDRDTDSEASGKKNRPVVLSIDDDRDISKALQMKLKPHGVECLSAFTGDQGYEMAVEHMPDVIITDLVLPEAEGIYIVRRIRSNPLLSDIPIIVLTGQSYPAIKHQILSLGVEAFLTKPIAINELLKELQGYIHIPTMDSRPSETFTANKVDGLVAAKQ